MLLRLLRYILGFGNDRSAEDEFHELVNEPGSKGRTLRARYVFADSDGLNQCVEYMKNLETNDPKLCDKFRASGSADFAYQTVVVDRTCKALTCEIDESTHTARFNMNHRMIGGAMFYRLIEGCLGARSKNLPKQRWTVAVLSVFKMLPCIWRMSKLEPNPIPSGPSVALEAKKCIKQKDGVPRRYAAYSTILEDACVALSKESIIAAFTVAFDDAGESWPLNNVGIVIIEYKKGSTQEALRDQFVERVHHAFGSNLLLNSGLTRMFGAAATGVGFRRKVDICCSTMVFGDDSIPCEIYVHPTVQVYEQAYVAMVSRLLPDGQVEVCTAITTNGHTEGWEWCGYIRHSIRHSLLSSVPTPKLFKDSGVQTILATASED